ncbi:MAG TPA: hypothetical protein VJT82_01515 [Pyrinomonadaceae bacterium]|nr:hypothetical protein [Pyrinomonadaceae bacterium]
MKSLSLHPTAARDEQVDLASEVVRLESLLAGRRDELTALQEALRDFKVRYTQVVGSRMAELAEIEQAIREAEARLAGVEAEAADESADATGAAEATPTLSGGSLKKLFWSVAKLFHPDHAADEREARRRHTIMVEASRAYREGDVESLHTLLGDEELQFFCTATQARDEEEDLASRLVALKEELRTVEFGIKRIRQDGLYRIKLSADEEAACGRDALAQQAERLDRRIVKARHRLANLT